MAKLHCPISGIKYACDHVPVTTKMLHPIFGLPSKKLLILFARYLKRELSDIDSYLLFLAYLNTIDGLEWRSPCSLDPHDDSTKALITNNLAQLVSVLERSNTVTIQGFEQPGFVINQGTSNLANIKMYIKAWNGNIVAIADNYRDTKAAAALSEQLSKSEEKLQVLITNGEYLLTAVKIAEWASLAANFPEEHDSKYRNIIRSCFNEERMFGFPLVEIKEVKDYCLANIELGSIYSHKLLEILNHGIELNKNYLGYTIISDVGYTSADVIATIIAKAPLHKPVKEDYNNSLDFLRAKIRYNAAVSRTN